MSDPPPRLVPSRELPSYAYRPGLPHPRNDPRGHSRGALRPAAPRFEEHRWGECEEYLWGIDLFNRGFHWEAHEAWEVLWRACPGRPVAAESASKKSNRRIFRRRPSGAEAGEAACRGRCGGGSASPANKETRSPSNSCSDSEFLKGLIQLTSAFWKARTGSPDGALRLARKARDRFAWVEGAARRRRYAGLDLGELMDLADRAPGWSGPDPVLAPR